MDLAEPPGAHGEPALRQQPDRTCSPTWAAPRASTSTWKTPWCAALRSCCTRAADLAARPSRRRRCQRAACAPDQERARRPRRRTAVAHPWRERRCSRRLLALGLLALLGRVAPTEFLAHLTVFVLACFIGWQVVWNVTPALHTPLMSVTNAISGIIFVGGMLQISGPICRRPSRCSAPPRCCCATINISGGFLVTHAHAAHVSTVMRHA